LQAVSARANFPRPARFRKGWNRVYKAEVIEHEGPWRGKKDVELATLDWVHWYNDKRLYGPLGYISPATAERNFYNAELTAKIAAE